MKKSFFIVEDHSLMRQGVSNYLTANTEFECTGFASNSEEFLSSMQNASSFPDILITDLNIEGKFENGISLIKQCRNRFPQIKIIVYSMHSAPSIISSVIDAGADGYVCKASDEKELKTAIENVMDGKCYVEPNLTGDLLVWEKMLSQFTPRENQVLNLILKEKTNEQIAEELGINKRTVENCISRIYNKTGFSSHHELTDKFGTKEK